MKGCAVWYNLCDILRQLMHNVIVIPGNVIVSEKLLLVLPWLATFFIFNKLIYLKYVCTSCCKILKDTFPVAPELIILCTIELKVLNFVGSEIRDLSYCQQTQVSIGLIR